MDKKILRFIVSLLFVAGMLGVAHYIMHLNETIEFKKVELLDNKTKIRILNDKYNELNQQLDTTNTDKQNIDEEYRKLQEEKEKLEAELQAKIEQKNKVSITATANASTTNIGGTKQEWMSAAGIPESDWWAVDYIVYKESTWNPNAVNRSSGATGLCQSLPASKMASAGSDYLTNPVTQLKWCNGYAVSRYGGWSGAYNFWASNQWW